MSIKNDVHYYAQPWPYCWIKMQWDLALWTSRGRGDPGFHFHVMWCEELLHASLTPEQFRLEAEEFLLQLQIENGTRFSWEVIQSGESHGHAVQLRWVRSSEEALT
jgi:hypothetical protein